VAQAAPDLLVYGFTGLPGYKALLIRWLKQARETVHQETGTPVYLETRTPVGAERHGGAPRLQVYRFTNLPAYEMYW